MSEGVIPWRIILAVWIWIGAIAIASPVVSPLEKADHFLAQRQFDEAIDSYSQVVRDSNLLRTNRGDWNQAVAKLVYTHVLMKGNLDTAIQVIDSILGQASLSDELTKPQTDLYTTWRKNLLDWRREGNRVPRDDDQVVSQSNYYIRLAIARRKDSTDHSADILILRSLAISHEYLSRSVGQSRRAELLLFAGMAYDSLNLPRLWPSADEYYKACVTAARDPRLARQCAAQLENRTFF